MQEVTLPSIEELLEGSAATTEFRRALIEFAASHRANQLIRFPAGNPPVKVLRALCGLLEFAPHQPLRSAEIHGASGCADYRGEITVNEGEKRFRFVWDCAWKARELGWSDFFGEPDQIRAAKTFGYRCFELFEEITNH